MICFWPIRVKVKASQAIEHRAIEHQAIEHYNTTTPTMHIYIKHCYYMTYAVHYSTTHCYCLEHFVHRTSIQNRTSRLRRIGQTWQIMDYHLITKKLFEHPWSWLFFIIDLLSMSVLTIIRLYHWRKANYIFWCQQL